MNEQIADFSFYCIFRKCPNFYGNGVCAYNIARSALNGALSLYVLF